jgi:hypothetical protein
MNSATKTGGRLTEDAFESLWKTAQLYDRLWRQEESLDLFNNIRSVAEDNIKMQQNLIRQWSNRWSSLLQPNNGLGKQVKGYQQDLTRMVTELTQKNIRFMDEQYRESVQSLDEALQVTGSADPQKYRQLCEDLIRKSIACLRETADLQRHQVQSLLNHWAEQAKKSVP